MQEIKETRFVSDWVPGIRKSLRYTHVSVFDSGGSRLAMAKCGSREMGECDELPPELS